VSSPTKVRLTASEMAMAKALDMSNEDYARGKYHTQLKNKG
jgi:phage I-like protein